MKNYIKRIVLLVLTLFFVSILKAQDLNHPICNDEAIYEIITQDITDNSVVLNWYSISVNSEFEITYGLKGFKHKNKKQILGELKTNYNLEYISGLKANTTYDFYIGLTCQEKEYAKKVTVTTLSSVPKPKKTRALPMANMLRTAELEKQALWDFYLSTNGPQWKNTISGNKPWSLDVPISEWYGVTLDSEGFVSKIVLQSNNLDGQIGESFKELTKLYQLNLRSNKITKLPDGIGSLVNLMYWYMENNELTVIPDGVGSLVNLRTLALSSNQISNVPPSIGNLSNLTWFSLDRNQLSTLPDTIGSLRNLTSLFLGENKLVALPNGIGNLSKLTYLNLKINFITSIPDSICNLNLLESLYVERNQLESIPVDIGNMGKLKYFEAHTNNIKIIPSSICKLYNLVWLSFDNNSISTVPENVGDLFNLVRVSLNHNKINYIPSSIGNLSKLTYLGLLDNELDLVPAEIGNLSKLKWLRIENNRIKEIPSTYTQLSSLVQFYLSNNNLNFSTLEGVYNEMKAISTLRLFQYSPQQKVDEVEAKKVVRNGTTKLTSNTLISSNNQYQWYRNGIAIAGANNRDLIITGADDSIVGVYYFKAVNSVVPGLTLERHPITLDISEGPIITPVSLATVESTRSGSFRPLYEKKYMISGWVKEKNSAGSVKSKYEHSLIRLYTVALESGSLGDPVFIGDFYPSGNIIDGWQRIEGSFVIETYENSDATAVNNLVIELKNASSEVISYFDDIRIFPFNGSMKSFVYDNDTKKLMAELDENNYATFYEYDKEGGLVRVKKETEKGIFTIQETRSSNAKR